MNEDPQRTKAGQLPSFVGIKASLDFNLASGGCILHRNLLVAQERFGHSKDSYSLPRSSKIHCSKLEPFVTGLVTSITLASDGHQAMWLTHTQGVWCFVVKIGNFHESVKILEILSLIFSDSCFKRYEKGSTGWKHCDGFKAWITKAIWRTLSYKEFGSPCHQVLTTSRDGRVVVFDVNAGALPACLVSNIEASWLRWVAFWWRLGGVKLSFT